MKNDRGSWLFPGIIALFSFIIMILSLLYAFVQKKEADKQRELAVSLMRTAAQARDAAALTSAQAEEAYRAVVTRLNAVEAELVACKRK